MLEPEDQARLLAARLTRMMAEAMPPQMDAGAALESMGEDGLRRVAREISRISFRYGWWSAVSALLEDHDVLVSVDLRHSKLETFTEYLRTRVEHEMAVCDFISGLAPENRGSNGH